MSHGHTEGFAYDVELMGTPIFGKHFCELQRGTEEIIHRILVLPTVQSSQDSALGLLVRRQKGRLKPKLQFLKFIHCRPVLDLLRWHFTIQGTVVDPFPFHEDCGVVQFIGQFVHG